MTRMLWLAAIALAACGTKADKPAPAVSDEAACKAAADEIGAALAKREEHPAALQAMRMTLVKRDELPATKFQRMPLVVLASDGMTFQGGLVNASELAERLQYTHAKIADDLARGERTVVEGDPDGIYFEIDAVVPWSRVVEATSAALGMGFGHMTFVFARTLAQEPARKPSPVDAEITAAEQATGDRALAISKVARKVADPCPALIRLFGRSAQEAALVAGVGPALVECKCAADPASVHAMAVMLLHNDWPTSDLALELAPTGTPTSFAAIAPWSEVGPQLAASSQPLAFQVRKH